MQGPITYGRQTIEDDDILAVVDVLRSGVLTQGSRIEEFEEAIAFFTGAAYAVCCSNGTSALHLACLAAGIGPGDRVITSPSTFIAASSIMNAGALPVFADIDPGTSNIDPAEAERAMGLHPGIKAIMPSHYAGLPCDMERISRIAAGGRLMVIEDACNAMGASWKDTRGDWRKVGSCAGSDMAVFSFHQEKPFTTGEGGAITTNSKALYDKLILFRDHGITRRRTNISNRVDVPWHYEIQELGFNYRLTDIQSALGLSQIRKLDRFIKRRSDIAALYDSMLSKYGFVRTLARPSGIKSAHSSYPVRIPFRDLGVDRAEWLSLMNGIGIYPQLHSMPVHLQPFFKDRLGCKAGDYPEAERLSCEEVSLPIYPLLTDEEAGAVVEGMVSALACAGVMTEKGPRLTKERNLQVI